MVTNTIRLRFDRATAIRLPMLRLYGAIPRELRLYGAIHRESKKVGHSTLARNFAKY